MSLISEWLADSSERSKKMGRPVITLSYAQSLDGSLTVRRGRPTTLSGVESLRVMHELRAAHQAVLLGIGTIIADDPQLTVRMVEGKNPQPIILDSYLRTPLDSKLCKRNEQLPWILVGNQVNPEKRVEYEKRGIRLISCAPATEEGYLDLPCLLSDLVSSGIDRLVVEGGSRVITSFLTSRLVDQVVITIKPVWIGGLQSVEHLLAQEIQPRPAVSVPGLVEPVYEIRGRDVIVWGRVSEEKL